MMINYRHTITSDTYLGYAKICQNTLELFLYGFFQLNEEALHILLLDMVTAVRN